MHCGVACVRESSGTSSSTLKSAPMYLSVCHEVHIYIKGWLPSDADVAVTANEMREGLSVSVCRHWHQTLCKLLQSETLRW